MSTQHSILMKDKYVHFCYNRKKVRINSFVKQQCYCIVIVLVSAAHKNNTTLNTSGQEKFLDTVYVTPFKNSSKKIISSAKVLCL